MLSLEFLELVQQSPFLYSGSKRMMPLLSLCLAITTRTMQKSLTHSQGNTHETV